MLKHITEEPFGKFSCIAVEICQFQRPLKRATILCKTETKNGLKTPSPRNAERSLAETSLLLWHPEIRLKTPSTEPKKWERRPLVCVGRFDGSTVRAVALPSKFPSVRAVWRETRLTISAIASSSRDHLLKLAEREKTDLTFIHSSSFRTV